MSTFHVAAAALMMALGTARLMQWRRWERQALGGAPQEQESDSASEPGPEDVEAVGEEAGAADAGAAPAPPEAPAAPADDATAAGSDGLGPAAPYKGLHGRGASLPLAEPPGKPATDSDGNSESKLASASSGSQAALAHRLRALRHSLRFQWGHRRTFITHRRQLMVRELLIILVKAFLPNLVNRRDFLLCR